MRVRLASLALLFLILMGTPVAFIRVSYAQAGSCFANGDVLVNTAIVWTDLSCTHTGNVVITGTGSLDLTSSTLVQNGNGSTSQILLNQQGRMVLQSSTVSFTNIGGSLTLLDNSSAYFSTNSNLFNAEVVLDNRANLTARQGSVINTASFASSALSSIIIDSSSLIQSGRNLSISGTFLRLNSANALFSNSSFVSLAGQTTVVQNSKIEFNNDTNIQIGNGASTNSNTSLTSSVVTVQSPSSATTKILGNRSLSILDTSVSSRIASSGLTPLSSLELGGGAVNVARSNLLSTAREYYGYVPNSASLLSVSASSSLTILNSQVIAGETSELGTFKLSQLALSSSGNATISSSLLQSASSSANLSLSAGSKGLANYLTLARSEMTTNNSPGRVTLRSSYAMTFENSRLDANQSSLRALMYSITAVDSYLLVQNITKGLPFGSGVSVGRFYNTTLGTCSSTQCLAPTGTGSFSQYGWIYAKVVDAANSNPILGATVAVTAKTGLSQQTLSTNQTGWAKFTVLLRQVNATGPKTTHTISQSAYVVQGFSGTAISPQQLIPQSNVAFVTIPLADQVNISAAAIVGESNSHLAAHYNMANYTYSITPAGQYGLGNYIGAQFVPGVTIVSNAVPLNFGNNVTNSEIDFNTVGVAGRSLSFIVIYPKNMTQLPFSILVDGSRSTAVGRASNSTSDFVVFTVPSGIHTIALSYLQTSGNYQVTIAYPKFFPPLGTIVALVALAAVGLGFFIVFLWRTDRAAPGKGAPKSN